MLRVLATLEFKGQFVSVVALYAHDPIPIVRQPDSTKRIASQQPTNLVRSNQSITEKARTTAAISSGLASLRDFNSRAAHSSQNGTLIRRLAGIGTAVSEPVRKQSGHSAGNSYDFLGTVTALQPAIRAIITLNVKRVRHTWYSRCSRLANNPNYTKNADEVTVLGAAPHSSQCVGRAIAR